MKQKVQIVIAGLVMALTGLGAALSGGYEVGDEAMDFKLKGVDDQEISMASFPEAKGFIIIFTCNHCPYAKAYEERIVALNATYSEKGYPLIAINPNDPELVPGDDMEHMKARAEVKGFTFPYLLDEGQNVYRTYGATRTPQVFVLERTTSGNIVRYIGAIDDNYEDADAVQRKYVEEAVDALLAGEDIKTTKTKAIGCTIKDKQK